MPSTRPPTTAAHHDRGWFVVIAASPYVAYAIHGTSAHLTRATRHPDGTVTLQPVGEPFTRLDLAVSAGRWRAEREAYAATAEHWCARCDTPITLVDGAWVCMDYTTTAGGLSNCPPDPDASEVGEHLPESVRGDNARGVVPAPMNRAETERGSMTTTIIQLAPARDDDRTAYGITHRSAHVYRVTGPGVHNRSYPHRVTVWDNTHRPNGARVGQGAYIDPSGKGTDADTTVTLAAEPVTIHASDSGTGTVASGQVYSNDALTTGQYVVLRYPDGTHSDPYRVESRPLSDPCLAPVRAS